MTSIFVYRNLNPMIVRGLTNQLLLLLNTINYINNNHPGSVLFLGNFYAQYDDDNSKVPFGEIIDLNSLNLNISLFDLTHILKDVEILLTWGSVLNSFPKEIFLNILQNENASFFNEVVDPEPGVSKQIHLNIPSKNLKYSFQERNGRLNVIYTDHMQIPNALFFSPAINNMMSVLQFLQTPTFFEIENEGRNCSVVHIRNENDGITWWSRQNNMTFEQYYNALNQKYIQLIEKYIPKEHILLILTSKRYNNPIIDHLQQSGYHILFNVYEDIGREKMAISDMILASKICNSVLIAPIRGSTYSVLLSLRLQYNKLVHFNLDRIQEADTVVDKGT